MSTRVLCAACQMGNHEHHVAGQHTPGVLGGWDCPCGGDCVAPDLSHLFPAPPMTTERLSPEDQVSEVRRVIEALHDSKGSIHGPLADGIRHSIADWLEAALDGRLDPQDARRGYPPKRATLSLPSTQQDPR